MLYYQCCIIYSSYSRLFGVICPLSGFCAICFHYYQSLRYTISQTAVQREGKREQGKLFENVNHCRQKPWVATETETQGFDRQPKWLWRACQNSYYVTLCPIPSLLSISQWPAISPSLWLSNPCRNLEHIPSILCIHLRRTLGSHTWMCVCVVSFSRPSTCTIMSPTTPTCGSSRRASTSRLTPLLQMRASHR